MPQKREEERRAPLGDLNDVKDVTTGEGPYGQEGYQRSGSVNG